MRRAIPILWAATLAAAAPPEAARILTTDTIWDWRTVGDPQISPDGRAVVYDLSWNDRMNDASYSNLWLVGVDGQDPRPLTQGPGWPRLSTFWGGSESIRSPRQAARDSSTRAAQDSVEGVRVLAS